MSSTSEQDSSGSDEGQPLEQAPCQAAAELGHHQQQALLVESKSQVLDEVDQLVDLMSEENATLTKKIEDLEKNLSEVGKKGSSLEKDNERLQTEYDKCRKQLKELEEKHSKESCGLKEALAAARRELKETRRKVETLTCDLSTEQEKRIKLHSAQVELKHKLKCLQGEHKSVKSALEVQCRESIKTSERCKTLTAENSLLQSQAESTHQKLKHSQDEVLALKGRLTNSKKMNDQLKAKYAELDKTVNQVSASKSPTVIKVVSRSKEEIRLLTECKRKDRLLEGYIDEMSTARETKLRLQDQLRRLEQKLKSEQKERQQLKETVEEKKTEWMGEQKCLRDKLSQCEAKLQAKNTKETESLSARKELQKGLSQIEEELEVSRKELSILREELNKSDKRSAEEKAHLEQEREKSKALLQVHEKTICRLRSELEGRERGHSKLVDELNDLWESRLQEAREDYRRMVEASTKRCTELAKEVWLLKEQLEELGGGDDKKTTPITDKHLHTHEQVTTADEDAH